GPHSRPDVPSCRDSLNNQRGQAATAETKPPRPMRNPMRRFLPLLLCLVLAPAAGADDAVLKAQAQEQPTLVLDAGGHTDIVQKVLFTPEGRELITVSHDKTNRVWDVATGELLRVLRPPIGRGREGMLYAAALTPDGRTLAVGGVGFAERKWGEIY